MNQPLTDTFIPTTLPPKQINTHSSAQPTTICKPPIHALYIYLNWSHEIELFMDVDLLEGDWNKKTYFQMVVKMMIYHGRKESNNLNQIQV